MAALTERFEMRLDAETIGRVDEWRARRGASFSRAEAIRRLVDFGLATTSGDSVHFSAGERVLLLMMQDLYKHVGLDDPEIDPAFFAKVILRGHDWAPKWRLPDVFLDRRDDPRTLKFVCDVLEMWTSLERCYEDLPKEGREGLENSDVKFPGFDGNEEGDYLRIANFLIDELGRFGRFRGRELNSHWPTLEEYGRMLSVYSALNRPLGADLSPDQIGAVLAA